MFGKQRPLPASLAPYRNAASRDIVVDGMRFHYRDEGQGPTLVLLHGVMASLHTWDGWVEALRPHYRIIRVDLPGFGFSDALKSHQYTPEYGAELFDKLRAALGIEHFHIAGNSLGGMLTWYYAVKYPQHVDKIILIDPIAYPQRVPMVMDLVSLPIIGEAARFITPRALVERNLRMVYGDQKLIKPGVIDRYYRLLMHGQNRRAMVDMFRTVKGLSQDTELSKGIRNVKARTLLMWGEADRWVPLSLVENWRRDIAGLEVKIYPGVGHVPMEEIPEQTARDAHAFLSKP